MKKYLLIALLIFISSAAQAQTLVSKETANSYYSNCIKAAPAQGFSQTGQQMLCACTAARLTQFFTMEDWKIMNAADPAIARPAHNKMMINVYAPCMGEPVRERYYNRCIGTQGRQQQLCTCTADKLSVYVQYHGPRLLTEILGQAPHMQDPWSAIENYPEFNAYIDMAAQECLK